MQLSKHVVASSPIHHNPERGSHMYTGPPASRAPREIAIDPACVPQPNHTATITLLDGWKVELTGQYDSEGRARGSLLAGRRMDCAIPVKKTSVASPQELA